MLLLRIFLVTASMLSAVLMPAKEEFVLVNGNKVTVRANTSLGSINCTYASNSSQKDTLFLNRQLPRKNRLRFSIPVEKFSCGNLLLNKDFANTLNAKDYPYTHIEVLSLKKQGREYKGLLKLELAGKTILLEDVQFNTITNQGSELLKSNILLNFSEIGLATPKKMGGLFKVDDELKVTVELQLSNSRQQTGLITKTAAP